jgi:hypothetical protein
MKIRAVLSVTLLVEVNPKSLSSIVENSPNALADEDHLLARYLNTFVDADVVLSALDAEHKPLDFKVVSTTFVFATES